MDDAAERLHAIFYELGDLWFIGGRTKITVTEVLGAPTMKTIHLSMTREWAQANRVHHGMTLVDIEDLEHAGLIEVDWGSSSNGRRGELRLAHAGEALMRTQGPQA
jgi:hypothetical protein